MIPYEKIAKKLEKFGYTSDENISDFWFANKGRLMSKIYGKGRHDGRFGKQVRWKSEIGIVCREAIICYINQKVENHRTKKFNEHDPFEFEKQLSDKKFKHQIPSLSDLFVEIDFNDFSFEYKGETLTIDDFEYHFPGSRSNYVDLTGIDLTGIRLENCVFKNTSFSCVNFNNSYFFQVTFENCNLGYCTFRNAHLSSIRLNKTLISGDFKNASLNAIIPFNDKTIHVPFDIKKISYINLLSLSIRSLNSKNIISFKKRRHTHFIAVDTKELESDHLTEIKNYIDWYQKAIDNSHAPVRNTFGKRLNYFLSVLFTKNWTSFSVLAGWYMTINIIFSALIYFGSCHFESSNGNFNPDFFQAFYHSIVTFSILGFGDLTPSDNIGRLLIMFEAIFGYIILGLFIFLLSRKIEKKI